MPSKNMRKIRYIKKSLIKGLAIVMLTIPMGNIGIVGEVRAEANQIENPTEAKNQSAEEIMTVIEEIFRWKKEQNQIQKGEFLFAGEQLESAGSSALDWYAFSMGRIGFQEDYTAYASAMKYQIEEKYRLEGGLDAQKATEWHRQILTLLAIGEDPANIEKQNGERMNLVADGTYARGKSASLGTQGLNGYIWGLLSLDAMRYQVPADAVDTRESILTAILDGQREDGGFSLSGTDSDVDITAMALQALAPYYNLDWTVTKADNSRVNVREAVERALNYLSEKQNEEGMIAGVYGASAESTAQVITALSCMGIDLQTDMRFIKNGKTLLDGLMQFQNEDGGFRHLLVDGADESNSIAGEQTAYALASYVRFLCQERSLYDMRSAMEETCREQIIALEEKLKVAETQMPEVDTLQGYYEEYKMIPAEERCYVYHYYVLAEAMEKHQISIESQQLKDYMEVCDSGRGTVTNLKDGEVMGRSITLTSQDQALYKKLPKEATTKDYMQFFALYEKVLAMPEDNQDKEMLNNLSQWKHNAQMVQKEIDTISEEIQKYLYPFENIGKEEEKRITNLAKRIEQLPEYDREQVLGYEELEKAKAELDTGSRTQIITIIAAGLIVVIVVFMVVRLYKRKKAKEEDVWDEE